MNLCAIHSQWYVKYCVYCGEPGKSKLQDLQTSEPFVMTFTEEQIKQLEEAFGQPPTFNQQLHDLFKRNKK